MQTTILMVLAFMSGFMSAIPNGSISANWAIYGSVAFLVLAVVCVIPKFVLSSYRMTDMWATISLGSGALGFALFIVGVTLGSI
jgi:p-aminobenzoyl-glutamate transporter AbgT